MKFIHATALILVFSELGTASDTFWTACNKILQNNHITRFERANQSGRCTTAWMNIRKALGLKWGSQFIDSLRICWHEHANEKSFDNHSIPSTDFHWWNTTAVSMFIKISIQIIPWKAKKYFKVSRLLWWAVFDFTSSTLNTVFREGKRFSWAFNRRHYEDEFRIYLFKWSKDYRVVCLNSLDRWWASTHVRVYPSLFV